MSKMHTSLWETCQTHHQAQWCIPNMARLLRTRTSIKLGHTINSDPVNTHSTRIIILAINASIDILAKYQIIQACCWPRVILGPHTWVMSIVPLMIFTMMNTTLMSKTLLKMMTTMLYCNNCQMRKTQKQNQCLYSLLLTLIKKEMRMILLFF